MLSTSQRILVRQNARGLRKNAQLYRQTPRRFQSTTSASQNGVGAYVAAGVAGGALVAASGANTGYAWYHFSGLKTIVDTSKSAKAYLQQAHATVQEKAKNPNEALAYLRQTAKTYVGLIPGLSSYVDSTFDAFDALAEKHGDEVNAIARKGYDEIQAIVGESGGKADLQTATKIMNVLQARAGELQELARRVGGDAGEQLFERYPQLREKLGGGYEQLRELVEKQGPEAKRIFDDTKKQVMQILSKGMSPEAMSQAQELVQSKVAEVRKLAESSAKQAWDSGLNQAQPYLDQLPEIRQMLEENAGKFIAAGAAALPSGGGVAKEVFDRIREVAESKGGKQKEKVEELKRFVQEKAREAEERGKGGMSNGWESLVAFIRTVPGGQEKTPNAKEFLKLSQERGDDAKQLAKETYEEILRVLEEKGKEAKKLAEETKDEAKKRS
ncbi:hypothetical protein GLOTRDRAFT_38540 [Gloeophyllum trabeum ATCC 11539]|uniref:Uncharacterized protein n=1 Tax=Gloeophyllum trabeum (strain ATCC 11539 / FP-39264 / Madison 617) TaxID=670483 RepID=S7QDQ7_GLOTA|nr:uncharacterized protein GLOTRDRAFT_38540 [Gloeophyllum trabeum ATCC 11539]EPQ57462.1 hypothetical protein GLOTRDRAFT_38540 [Gloeophyllum trabeum ATCC 11539]